MLKQKDVSDKMSKDIDEMEKMLNDYLHFAKTQAQETTSEIDLIYLLNSLKNEFNNKNLSLNYNDLNIKINGRPIALKRSL